MTELERIDVDVHCAVPSVAALAGYLDPAWAEFLTVTGFREPPGVNLTYPGWLPMLATNGKEITIDRVRSDVLTKARVAILNCFYSVEGFTHPYLGPAVATAVNNWLADRWLSEDDRLLANAVLTPQHMEAAVEEIYRIAGDKRFVGVLVPSRSPVGYGNHRYWPMLDALAEQGLALTLNIGGAPGSPPTPINWPATFFEDHTLTTLAFQAQIMSLVFSGIFDRQPALRVAVMESGWTWLPPLMWRMDQEWKAFRREVPWLQGPPSSYVRRHFRFATQPTDTPPDAAQLGQVYEQLGSDEMLMYASDYPHQQGSDIDALFDRLDADQVRRLNFRNALDCFPLDRQLETLSAGV
jgi:predicted TIM-barrel fold metal-dependent hydrolase